MAKIPDASKLAAKKKPGPGKAGPGRPKGVPNKMSGSAKDNVMAVFNRLKGTAGMAKWARANPTDFYRIYARLVPQQIDLEVTERPVDVSMNPLTPEEWDKQFSVGKPN